MHGYMYTIHTEWVKFVYTFSFRLKRDSDSVYLLLCDSGD